MQSTLAGKSIEQDLSELRSRLVPDSVITLDDWELENDDVDHDDAGSEAGCAGRAGSSAGSYGGLGA
jgi:LmbE family N-acetylglucosaminyl deacetylase